MSEHKFKIGDKVRWRGPRDATTSILEIIDLWPSPNVCYGTFTLQAKFKDYGGSGFYDLSYYELVDETKSSKPEKEQLAEQVLEIFNNRIDILSRKDYGRYSKEQIFNETRLFAYPELDDLRAVLKILGYKPSLNVTVNLTKLT